MKDWMGKHHLRIQCNNNNIIIKTRTQYQASIKKIIKIIIFVFLIICYI